MIQADSGAALRRALLIGSIGLIVGAVAWAHWPRSPLPEGTVADRVVVLKAERRLELYDGADLIRSYSVALGREPVGSKRQEGDKRTPEGTYTIDYRNPQSSFHLALHISYPRPDQVAAAVARGVAPGGLVMIHGLPHGFRYVGRFHRLRDWTIGCIAVTNRKIEEIWRVVPDGTPIEIRS